MWGLNIAKREATDSQNDTDPFEIWNYLNKHELGIIFPRRKGLLEISWQNYMMFTYANASLFMEVCLLFLKLFKYFITSVWKMSIMSGR